MCSATYGEHHATQRHAHAHDGIVTTYFPVANDRDETARFYSEMLGGEIVFAHEDAPTFVKLANTWVIINLGGGPTADKPESCV